MDERHAGRHRITLDDRAKVPFWNATGPDDMVPTNDNSFPYQRDVNGIWDVGSLVDGPGIAHEVGHALGLGDDYFITCTDANDRSTCKTTGYKPTGEGMGEGSDVHFPTFTTSGAGVPDPATVWRVLQQIKAAGLLPQCWKASFQSRAQGYIYNDQATGELTFLVQQYKGAAAGLVSGKGRVHLSHEPQRLAYCTHINRQEPDEFDVKVYGFRVGDEFKLQIAPSGAVSVTHTSYGDKIHCNGKITNTHQGFDSFIAGGLQAFTHGVPAKNGSVPVDASTPGIAVNGTIELKCATC